MEETKILAAATPADSVTAALPLDVYAAVLSAIAAGLPRHEALAAHGLTEESFEPIEEHVEAELSKAADYEGEGVHPFYQAYEAAMRRAQAKVATPEVVSIEQFARGVAAVQRGGDPVHALERLGLTPKDLVRALSHWGERMAKDRELAETFEAIRTGRKR